VILVLIGTAPLSTKIITTNYYAPVEDIDWIRKFNWKSPHLASHENVKKSGGRITHETMAKGKLVTFAVTLWLFHYIILHIASMSQTNFFSVLIQYLYWENV
jgi:hypothetical protein